MRVVTIVAAGMAAICAAGFAYLREMGLDAKGTTISQEIKLSFARRAMFRIAAAEREQVTEYSECFSVDQLVDAGKLDPEDRESGGYSITVSCEEDSDFTVSAVHTPEPRGSSLRWPALAVDKSLEFHETFATDYPARFGGLDGVVP